MRVIIRRNRFERPFGYPRMKSENKYLKFVLWSDEDGVFVGYCPDLFRGGGVCHAATEEECYRILCELVHEEVEDLEKSGQPLPPASTRPMREAIPA
jgi:predicted RNase H-like HicB family nuclease